MCLDQMQHSPSALPSSKDGLFYNVGLGYNHYAVMFRLEETTSQKTKTHATHATHATHIPSVAEWLSNTTYVLRPRTLYPCESKRRMIITTGIGGMAVAPYLFFEVRRS